MKIKKIISAFLLSSMIFGVCANAANFAHYEGTTVCVYDEPGASHAGENVSVMVVNKNDAADIAHIGFCNVAEDGTWYYKFEVPTGKTMSDYKVIARTGEASATEMQLTKKPADMYATKVSIVKDALFDADLYIKNFFANSGSSQLVTSSIDENERFLDADISSVNLTYGWRGENSTIKDAEVDGAKDSHIYLWDRDNNPLTSAVNLKDYSLAPFEDGDVVSFTGDSNAHLSTVPAMLEHFYQTRFPEKNIRVINTGIGGDVVGGYIGEDRSYGVIDRLDWDVYDENPNKIYINCATNDIGTSGYDGTNDYKTGYNSIRYNSCIENYKNLMDRVEATDGKELTILGAPTVDVRDTYTVMVEDWSNGYPPSLVPTPAVSLAFEGDDLIEAYTAMLGEIEAAAISKGVEYLDIFKYTTDLTNEMAAKNPTGEALISQDRIHLTDGGYTTYAAIILLHQGMDSRVAEVKLDAVNGKLSAYRADVNLIESSENGVTYTYKPESLPLATSSWYTAAEKIIPLTDLLNREIIQVDGLASGTYSVTFTDENGIVYDLGDFSSAALAKGINIATIGENPSQKQSMESFGHQNTRRNHDRGQTRNILMNNQDRPATGTISAADLAEVNELKAVSKGYSDAAKEAAIPVDTYTVSITKN